MMDRFWNVMGGAAFWWWVYSDRHPRAALIAQCIVTGLLVVMMTAIATAMLITFFPSLEKVLLGDLFSPWGAGVGAAGAVITRAEGSDSKGKFRVQFYKVGHDRIGWIDTLPDLEFMTLHDAVKRHKGALSSKHFDFEYDAAERSGIITTGAMSRICGYFIVTETEEKGGTPIAD